MGLADDLLEEGGASPGRTCGVRTLLPELVPDDRQALLDALANPKLTATGIQRALDKNGFHIGARTLQRHRAGDCSCGKEG